jgi:hypothetical protein
LGWVGINPDGQAELWEGTRFQNLFLAANFLRNVDMIPHFAYWPQVSEFFSKKQEKILRQR